MENDYMPNWVLIITTGLSTIGGATIPLHRSYSNTSYNTIVSANTEVYTTYGYSAESQAVDSFIAIHSYDGARPIVWRASGYIN